MKMSRVLCDYFFFKRFNAYGSYYYPSLKGLRLGFKFYLTFVFKQNKNVVISAPLFSL